MGGVEEVCLKRPAVVSSTILGATETVTVVAGRLVVVLVVVVVVVVVVLDLLDDADEELDA